MTDRTITTIGDFIMGKIVPLFLVLLGLPLAIGLIYGTWKIVLFAVFGIGSLKI